MKSRRWLIAGVVGSLIWAWLAPGLAHAGAVPPTDQTTLKLSADTTVTVSLYQLDSTLPATVGLQSPSRCTTTGTQVYRDVTDCWLPEVGKEVYVVVNPPTAGAPALVLPTATIAPGAGTNPFLTGLTTSAYPGTCTNTGKATDTGPDFPDYTLDTTPMPLQTSTTSLTGYKLTPTDCGGMAIVRVGNLTKKFILPKDGTTAIPANGIPEVWETLYRDPNRAPAADNLDPAADIDTGPVATAPCCDGLSAFDEYRGFIVSGKQIRTDPTQKDLFLHLVTSADSVPSLACGTSCLGGGTTTYPAPTSPNATLAVAAGGTFTTSPGVFSNAHVGGEIIGNTGGRARIVAVAGPTSATAEVTQAFPGTSLAAGAWKVSESLFALVYTMVPPERVHFLQAGEWVDNFVSLVPAQTLTISDLDTDRTVNPNRLYGQIQKGLRVMEALNINAPSVLGYSFGVASPNVAGNVVAFTQRAIDYVTALIGSATILKYSTASLDVNGVSTWSTPILVPDGDVAISQDGVATNTGVRNFMLSKAFQFYFGHEVGHSLDLTPDVQGTSKTPTSYGHHFAPGTGDCLDQAITTTSKSGTVTFNIPSLCGSADQAQFVLR